MQLSSRSSRSATAQSLYTGALTPASTRPPLRRALVCRWAAAPACLLALAHLVCCTRFTRAPTPSTMSRAEGRAPPAPDCLLPAGRSAEAPLRSRWVQPSHMRTARCLHSRALHPVIDLLAKTLPSCCPPSPPCALSTPQHSRPAGTARWHDGAFVCAAEHPRRIA